MSVVRYAIAFSILLGTACAENEKLLPKPAPPQPSAVVPALPEAERLSPSPKLVLERVAVVGASVSAGVGGSVPLPALLDHATHAKHEPVLDATDKFMGVNVFDSGEYQFDQVVEADPTLVIAVDFLFWYAHTLVRSGEDELTERKLALDRGLEQVARAACPVVLGDIPDMSGAQFKTLTPNRMPSLEVLVALNQHVRDWAVKHRNVTIVPLDAWVKRLRSGQWVLEGSLDGQSKTTVLSRDDAFVPDKLHPSTLGALALGEQLIAFLRESGGVTKSELELDMWGSYRKLLASRQPAEK